MQQVCLGHLALVHPVKSPEEEEGALETKPLIIMHLGASLVVQQLRPYTSPTGDMGLIPGQGTKILHAAWQWLKTKTKNPQ